MSGSVPVLFRIAYARYSELRDDVTQQMARGGLLVKVHDTADLTLDTEVLLELVLPDGTQLHGAAKVLQVLTGFGVAVSVPAELVDRSRRAASGPDAPGSGPARHARVAVPWPGPRRAPSPTLPPPPPAPARPRPATLAPSPPAPGGSTPAIATPALQGSSPAVAVPPPPRARPTAPPPSAEARPGALQAPVGPSRQDKIQQALHGNRDERHAILRDRDRTLHPFVLKNPRLDADDVLAIAKNAQMTAEMLSLIGDRKEWLARPAIALALAKNPRTPPELAVRALDHVSTEALRQLAKGTGGLPHVTQAARKKLLG